MLGGVITVVLTLVFWSSVPLFLRYFAESIDPWTSNGWRYGFSALLWAPLLLFGAARKTLPPGLFRAALVPSLVNAAGQVVFCYAHYKINPGLLAFGLRSNMIFAAVGAYLLFSIERPVIRSPVYVLGVLAVLAGTSLVVLRGDQPFEGEYAQGIALAISSGFFFALYALSVRRYMTGFNAVVAFAAISQYTAAAMVVLMLILGRRAGLEALDLGSGDFVLLLVSAVIGIALGHVLYYVSIARLGVAVSAGVLQLHPFGVAVASYFLFQELLTGAQWAGGVLALIGAILMLGVRGRQNRPARRMLAT